MRTKAEIETAHALVYDSLKKGGQPLDPACRHMIAAVADVLCWVLGHESEFAGMAKDLAVAYHRGHVGELSMRKPT